MRDPDARIRFDSDFVVRDLYEPLPAGHFLHHELATRWASSGKLIPFELRGTTQVVGRRLTFVSQPSEWTSAQLHAAANLTLDLQCEAVDNGFDLKDASAWNVIFEGARPVFCDLLSFTSLTYRQWWAFGQFSRHFLLPLLASRRVGFRAGESFLVWRDGMPPDVARRMLGWQVVFSRYGALVAGGQRSAHSSVDIDIAQRGRLSDIQSFRRRLQVAIDWQLRGLAPINTTTTASGWSGYQGDRPHYGGDSVATKRNLLDQWLTALSPAWVLDLGCNTGEFSEMALAHGAHVIALDADHDSVEHLFLSHPGEARLYPIVARLDDLRGPRGWGCSEHTGLDARLEGSADLVLVLALIHHLAVGASIPLEAIADLLFRYSRDAVAVELIEEDDSQLRALCAQRQRTPSDFTLDRQRDAFLQAGFKLVHEAPLEGARRSLALFRKAST